MNILVINAGSSSLKYQLFDMAEIKVLAKGLCERIGIAGGKNEALLFISGQKVRMLKDNIVDQFIDEIHKL